MELMGRLFLIFFWVLFNFDTLKWMKGFKGGLRFLEVKWRRMSGKVASRFVRFVGFVPSCQIRS